MLTKDMVCPKALSHTTKKILPSWIGPKGTATEPLYVLPLPLIPGGSAFEEAHADPVIPVSYVTEAERPAFEAQRMTVSEWRNVFTLKSSAAASMVGSDEVLTESQAAWFLKTPLKASFKVEAAPDVMTPLEIVLKTEADPGVPDAVRNDLRSISDSVREVQVDVGMLRSEVVADRAVAKSVEQTSKALTTKMNLLGTMVGDGSASSFPTAWSGIHAVKDSVEATALAVLEMEAKMKAMEDAMERRLEAMVVASRKAAEEAALSAKKAAGEEVVARLLAYFPPEVLDAIALASGGGVVDARVDGLVDTLVSLRAEVARLGSASVGVAPALDEALLRGLIEARVETRLEHFAVGLSEVEMDLRRLRARAEAETVMIGDVSLSSMDEAIAFVEANGLQRYPYFFQSPVTLMEIVWYRYINTSGDPLRQADQECKLGLEPAETAVQASFQNRLPSVLGDGLVPHKLSRVPLFSDWKSRDFTKSSTSELLRQNVKNACVSLKYDIRRVTPPLNSVVTHMLFRSVEESAEWIFLFIDFVSQFYEDYEESTTMGGPAVWALLQFLVRALFDEFNSCKRLADTIRFGAGCRQSETTGRVLWAGFAMHGLMKSYPEKNWEGHPTLSPAIAKFLLVGVAMKSDLEVVTTSVSDLATQFKAVEKKVDLVAGKAQRAQGAADNAANKKKAGT